MALVVLLLAAVPAQILSPAAAAPSALCPGSVPAFEAAPADLPDAGLPLPVRDEPDGARTLMIAVQDPSDVPSAYQHVNVGSENAGIWAHRWPSARNVVTYGMWARTNSGLVRVPVLLVENGVAPDLALSMLVAAYDAPTAIANNSTPFVLNTIAPTPLGFYAVLQIAGGISGIAPVVGGLVSALAFQVSDIWMMYFRDYPRADGFRTQTPTFIWTTYRTAPGAQVWQGIVVTNEGAMETRDGVRDGCRRTRIGLVSRVGAGAPPTVYAGGVYVLQHSAGGATKTGFEAHDELWVGATAGTTDLPASLALRQAQSREGTQPFWADQHRDEIALGVEGPTGFVPLIGSRAESSHHYRGGGIGQDRLVSIGVYDPVTGYRPVVGTRMRFERIPSDYWPLAWALSGGPGASGTGDWEIDLGVFDATGAFVPVLGTTYADDFAEAVYAHQTMITAGPWAGGTYQPALGVTYDGDLPAILWALFSLGNAHQARGRWVVSAGSFSPVGCAAHGASRRCPYLPVAGATFEPASSPRYPVVEQYRAGVFPASYSQAGQLAFVPLVGVDWSNEKATSANWASGFASGGTKAPSSGRIDAGPVVGGTMVPVLGATIDAGSTKDHYGVGAWAAGTYVPLARVCYKPGLQTGTGSIGVAAGGGAGAVPLVWVIPSTSNPQVGTLQDCPG